jgi:hypothetical protein
LHLWKKKKKKKKKKKTAAEEASVTSSLLLLLLLLTGNGNTKDSMRDVTFLPTVFGAGDCEDVGFLVAMIWVALRDCEGLGEKAKIFFFFFFFFFI